MTKIFSNTINWLDRNIYSAEYWDWLLPAIPVILYLSFAIWVAYYMIVP